VATMIRTVTLALDGEFDITNRDDLERAVLDAVEAAGTGRVVVDLHGVSFIDSEAVAAIIVGYRAALAAGCDYRLARPRGLVRRILDIAGLWELIGEEDGAAAAPRDRLPP
jgi:anti-anti-sigma factor